VLLPSVLVTGARPSGRQPLVSGGGTQAQRASLSHDLAPLALQHKGFGATKLACQMTEPAYLPLRRPTIANTATATTKPPTT
jgi:hypothetical protein